MKLRILKGVALVLGLLLLVLAGYVAYVFLTYYRLEDNLALDTKQSGDLQEDAVEQGRTYRVVSYNIGFGAYSDDYSFFMDGGKESRGRSEEAVVENVTGALTAAKGLEGDFVLLQEVDVDGTRSHHVDEAALARDVMEEGYTSTFAQNYDSPYLFWPLLEPHGANRSGILTFSRYPITSALRRSLPIESGFMKLVDLDRCYSVQRIPVDGGKELVLYNIHLSAYTSDGTIAEEQLELLFSDMLGEYEKGNWAIAGGDFNKDLLGDSAAVFGIPGGDYTWAQPIPPERIPEGVTLVAPMDEADPVPSCRNADRPYGPDNYVLVVDGFVVTANVSVEKASVLDEGFQWSDHNPVYMDFSLEG